MGKGDIEKYWIKIKPLGGEGKGKHNHGVSEKKKGKRRNKCDSLRTGETSGLAKGRGLTSFEVVKSGQTLHTRITATDMGVYSGYVSGQEEGQFFQHRRAGKGVRAGKLNKKWRRLKNTASETKGRDALR